MHATVLVVLGLCIGVGVEGLVSSFHFNASYWPWPRCRACGGTADWRVAIPIVGGLGHRRCSGCGQAQQWRALQIEAATAVAFVALGLRYWDQPILLVVSLTEASILVTVLFIDLELRLIPHLLVAFLVVLGLASSVVWPSLGLWNALAGGLVGFGIFGVLVVLAHFVFGDGALGMGDANLALAIGCITGYPLVVISLASGIFIGGVGAVFMVAVRRHGLRTTMPYGPYLVVGVLYILARGNTANPLLHF